MIAPHEIVTAEGYPPLRWEQLKPILHRLHTVRLKVGNPLDASSLRVVWWVCGDLSDIPY